MLWKIKCYLLEFIYFVAYFKEFLKAFSISCHCPLLLGDIYNAPHHFGCGFSAGFCYSLSHGAASFLGLWFRARFAILFLSLNPSRSRFPHWGHVISSGVWMWQENDSALSLFMHFTRRVQRSNSRRRIPPSDFSADFPTFPTFPTTYFIRPRWCKRLPSCWHVAGAEK